MTQKNHKNTNFRMHHLPNIMVEILSFCGGAYPKFGIDRKVVHYERWNTKIGIIKKSI